MHVSVLAVFVAAGCGRLGFDARIDPTGDGGIVPCTEVCECNVDDDCTVPHQVCDIQGPSRTRECAAGYAELGGGCTWVGVVTDPGFQDPAAWALTTGGAIDPARSEGGMADFGAAGLDGFARVRQVITMPRLSRSELLVVEISSRGTPATYQPSVKVGTHWYDLPGNTVWNVTRRCLGAAQYAPESSRGKGVAIPLEVMPTYSGMTLYVDRVEIKPALVGECTAPGPVVNSDAETDAGWAFRTAFGQGANSSSAGFVTGQGANGSRAARLFIEKRCDVAELTIQLALPGAEELPSPALSFFNRTTAGGAVEIDAPLLSMVPGTGTATTFVQCLLPFQRGEPLALKGFLSSGGACAQVVNFESIFDDIAIINEPKCGSGALVDPGFESRYLPLGVDFEATASTASIVTGATQVHGGTAALKLAATRPCYGPSYTTYVEVPPTSPMGGPALAFFYKATPVAQYSFMAGTTAITQDNTWRRGVICFDPLLAGRSQRVSFAMSGGGSCLVMIPEEYVLLDDFALTNDPSCPN